MAVRRHTPFLLCVAACGSAGAHGAPPGRSTDHSVHDAAWGARRCAEDYAQIEQNWASYTPPAQATSPFRHCPRWRMAYPEVCGAAQQPSFLNPCQCMCDLCTTDDDCDAGSSCVELPSVLCGGGMLERVCVKQTDVCHPRNVARRCPTYCVTMFGKVECVSRQDTKICGH